MTTDNFKCLNQCLIGQQCLVDSVSLTVSHSQCLIHSVIHSVSFVEMGILSNIICIWAIMIIECAISSIKLLLLLLLFIRYSELVSNAVAFGVFMLFTSLANDIGPQCKAVLRDLLEDADKVIHFM